MKQMFEMDDLSNNYMLLYDEDFMVEKIIIINKDEEPIIKRFFESLKITFNDFWNRKNKTEWVKLINVISILDTYHLKNLINIYNEDVFMRYHSFNKYLKSLNRGFKSENVGYFIISIQHFLQKR